jgi:hypothetical protein
MSFSRPHIAYIRLSGKLPSKFGKSSYSSVPRWNSTKNSMKYRSLLIILKYCFNIPNLIFHAQNIGISYRNGMLKQYFRIVCKD